MKTTYLDNGDGDTLGLCLMQGLTGPNPCILVIRHYWNFEFPAVLCQLQSVLLLECLNENFVTPYFILQRPDKKIESCDD